MMFNKYRVTHKSRFIIFTGVFLLLVMSAFSTITGAINASGSSANVYETVTVQPGDTLWSIAERHMDDSKDIRKFIYEIKKLNNVSADTLTAGQKLMIPA